MTGPMGGSDFSIWTQNEAAFGDIAGRFEDQESAEAAAVESSNEDPGGLWVVGQDSTETIVALALNGRLYRLVEGQEA